MCNGKHQPIKRILQKRFSFIFSLVLLRGPLLFKEVLWNYQSNWGYLHSGGGAKKNSFPGCGFTCSLFQRRGGHKGRRFHRSFRGWGTWAFFNGVCAPGVPTFGGTTTPGFFWGKAKPRNSGFFRPGFGKRGFTGERLTPHFGSPPALFLDGPSHL